MRISSVVIQPGEATKADLKQMEYRSSIPRVRDVSAEQQPTPAYVCIECDYTCNTKASLRRHMRTHQPAEHKCLTCDKRFAKLSSLVSHAKSHREVSVSASPSAQQMEEARNIHNMIVAQTSAQQKQHEEVRNLLAASSVNVRPVGALDAAAAQI